MEWGNTGFSNLPFHVSSLVAEHGRQAVYDLYLDASRNSSDPQRSHALAYLAAGIDSLPARAAAESFTTAVENHKKKVDAYNKTFRSMGDLILSIDFQSLVFWDLLVEKAPSIGFLMNLPIRPFIVHPQPAELIAQKITELKDESLKWQDCSNHIDADVLRMRILDYCSDRVISQIEQQIEIYRYFTDYDCLFSTHEQREKLSTHIRFEVAPGKLYQLVEKGSLYRDLESKLKRLKKIVSRLRSCDEQVSDSAKHYNQTKSEVEKFVPYGLAHYIDNYQDIKFVENA
ncbi:hypothetical protein [Pseudomonas sp. T8]|uniref:hypothetical protein n=1 Tax=Pseudomonas sp. T8 TaxID=645292 RepID=UPI00214950DB|nr:hypothetical protein [Pseudomonas sp. T8]UUT24049.1 hypothetical protein NRG23_08810 [Pseudomonas sp. T8]